MMPIFSTCIQFSLISSMKRYGNTQVQKARKRARCLRTREANPITTSADNSSRDTGEGVTTSANASSSRASSGFTNTSVAGGAETVFGHQLN